MANSSVYGTQASNTPQVIAGDGSSSIQVLPSNPARIGFGIQSVGTTTVYLQLGSGATATVFHMVLKGGTGNNDGLGASFSMTSGAVYTGPVTFFGASTARVVAFEIAP